MARVPLSHHAAQLSLILLCMALVRVPGVASPLSRLLRPVMPADGFYVRRFTGGYYEDMSSVNWLLHFALIPCGLEIVGAFRRLARASGRQDQRRQERVYQIMAVIFGLSQVQASITLIAHSLIGAASELEVSLMVVEFTLLRMNAFGTGIFLLLEHLGAPAAAILACGLAMAPLVMHDYLLFGNRPGIISSSASMIMVCANQHLPWLYKAAWLLLSAMPALCPASSTDVGHARGTAGLVVPLALMPYALCRFEASVRKKAAD